MPYAVLVNYLVHLLHIADDNSSIVDPVSSERIKLALKILHAAYNAEEISEVEIKTLKSYLQENLPSARIDDIATAVIQQELHRKAQRSVLSRRA